jgi:hypothetical protein
LGLFILYKYYNLKSSYLDSVGEDSKRSAKLLDYLAGIADKTCHYRLIFLHHSVGEGLLYGGGLSDSLRAMGIFVKGATYGDEIGENTDMCHWLPKFQNDMDKIIRFKIHPNRYYGDETTNDIIMFKSCFPNSDITGDGVDAGDPYSRERTLANYRAVFNELKNIIAGNKDKLFIYLTAPPLVRQQTSPANAAKAREFNNWLVREFQFHYRQSTGLTNFAVFDLFDVLADSAGFLKSEYQVNIPGDSHPNSKANQTAVRKFMEFFGPLWEKWQKNISGKAT